MPTPGNSDPIAVLRAVLADVERSLDPVSDALALATTKRILLHIIAEFELDRAQELRKRDFLAVLTRNGFL